MSETDVAAVHGDLLLELSFLVNERKSVDEVFASFSMRLLEATSFDYTNLLIGEPGNGYMEVLASYPFELPGAKAGQAVPTNSFKFDDLLAAREGYEYVTRKASETPASREMAEAGMSRAWVSALVSEGLVYGVFTAARKSPEPFNEDERAFMLAACRLLTAAVRQEMELRVARRAAARAEAANELALALSSGESIEESFKRLTSLVHTSLAADYVGLFLDREGGFMLVDEEPRGVHKGMPPTEEGTRFILEQLATSNFVQSRPQKGASPSDSLVDAGYRRVGIAVLRESERPAGLMIVGRKSSLRFNEDEQAFIELLRSLLSQSLTNSRRLAKSEAEAARSHTLNEVALLLNRGETVDAIFNRLLDLLAKAIDIDYVGLLEATDRHGTFRMTGSRPEVMRPPGTLVDFDDRALQSMLRPDGSVLQYRIEGSVDLMDYNRRMYEEGMRRGVSVALRQGDEILGLLAIARRLPNRYVPEEVAFIETLSSMLAQAIANQRRLERAQIAAARAHVLNEAALLLKQDQPADAMFANLLPVLREALSFDYVALLEVDETTSELVLVAAEPQLVRGPGDRLPLENVLVSSLSQAESPAVQFRLDRVEGITSGLDELRAAGMERGVAALLRQGDEIVGMFALNRREAERLTGDEMSFILTLGNLLGQAIANRRRLETAERQAARSLLLNDLAAQLDAGEPLEALFAHLPGVLPAALDYDHFSLLKVAAGESAFRVVGVTPALDIEPGALIPWPASPELRERLQRRPLIRYNPQEAGEAARILAAAGYHSAVTVMLRDGDEVIGSIQIARIEARQFNEEQCEFIETLASLLARAIANQNRLEQARREAERTRLLNELSVLLHDGQGPEALFKLLTTSLSDLIRFDSLSLLVAEGTRLRVVDSLRRQSMKPGDTYALQDLGEALERLSGRELVWEIGIDDVDGPIAEVSRAGGILRAAIVALRHNQELAGFMFVARTVAEPFTAEELAYIEILATMLAQAIANHKKLRESEAEAIRSQVLSELAMLFQEGDAIASRFEGIAHLLLQTVGFDHVSVTVRQPSGDAFDIVRSDDLLIDGQPLQFDPAGIALLSEHGRMSAQIRTEVAERNVPRALHSLGFERAATALVVSADGVEGLLTIGRRQDIRFDDGEMAFIELVAALIGQATANHRRAWRKAQEAEEQAIIAEAASAVAREMTTLGIASALREAVGRFIPLPFCNFGYLEGDAVVFSAPGRDRIVLPIGPGFRRALDHGYDLVTKTALDSGTEAASSEVERTGLQSHVIAIAQSGGETVGLLIVGSRDPAFEPGDREVRLSRLIADIVGPAMANVRAVERQRLEGEDQRLLAEVATAAAREGDPAALLTAIHRPMRAIVPSPTVIFGYRIGDETVFPRLDGSYVTLPLDPYLRMLDDVVQIHSDALPEDLNPASELWRMGLHAISTTAVLAAGKTVGYLMVASRAEGYRFGERELRLFRLLAQIVGPAMENARASERAREDAEEQSILAEAAAAMAAGATEAEVIAGLTPAVQRFLPGALATVFYVDGDQLNSPEGLGADRFGPAAAAAMEVGQVVVERPWPELSPTGRALLDRGNIQRFVNTSLNAGGVSTGILFVGVTGEATKFRQRDLRLIRLIADMAGPALANARESSLRRQEAEEQRFLAEAAAIAASATSEGELVRGMARRFRGLFPGAKLDLLFHQDGAMQSAITGLRFPVGAGFREALETGQSVGTPSSPGTTEPSLKRQQELGIKHNVSTRLSSSGQTLGLFWLGTTDDQPWTERDLRICRLVADVVGPALANLRESRRRKEDAEEQRFLAETAAAAASAATQEDLAFRLSEPLKELLPGARIDMFYLENGVLMSTVTGRPFPIGPNFARALRDGQHLLESHDEAGTVEAAEALQRLNIVQALSLRLSSSGQALGLLWIGTTAADRRLTDRDIRILRLVADVAGPALANLRESRRRKEDAEDQRFLAAVAASVARATTQDELIRGLWEPFRSITPGCRVAFFYREGDVLRGPGGDYGIGPQIEQAFREGLSLGHIADEEVLPKSREYMRTLGITSWANLLAESEGESLGILHVALRDEARTFSQRELRLYRLAAAIVGPAMAHLRDNARRAREAEDERVLARVAAMAAVTSSPDELICQFAEILDFIPEPLAFFGHAMGDQIRYRISLPYARDLLGLEDLIVPLSGASKEARESGQGVGHLGSRVDQPYSPLNMQAYAVTAYHSMGSEMGLLLVATRDPGYSFSIEDLTLLRRIVQVLGPAIEAARAEAERARQADLYGLMLRSLSEGVILTDNTGRPVFSNELGRKLLRALNPTGGEVDWADVIPLLPEEAREPYRRVFEHGEPGRGRTALLMDGQLTYLDFELVPLQDPQMKLLVVVTDVTADVLHEEEQQRNRERMEQAARLAALGELIGGVAHELNNPLTAVVGFAELMSANPAAESLSEEISVIQKEARRAADIVRDLLFIARPGTSERSQISVSELIGHIERIRRAHWAGAGIQPAIAIDAGCQVWGNEHQLTQVILNLVTNAEHALAGQPQRRLRLSASCASGRTIITVSDTGKGMDQATLERIWEPFYTTKPGVGTGLGLPLSYSIIQSHQGVISVESTPGVGTTFRLDLPTVPDAPAATAEEPARDVSIARVLVVDDEPSLRKVCQRLVASLGHECDTAENSAAALEFAKSRDYDLVLCDYRLATETADRVIAGFSEVAPWLIERTVIATGATTDAGVLDLTEKHNLQLIAKPYGAEELSRIIAEALERTNEAAAG